jgi:Arc/MetJ-type ribon-helix-helix transcriptional regulator
MSKVMFSLPQQLVSRMRVLVPEGERSELVASLLEKEIKTREKKLFQRASELEACNGLSQEMAEWDHEFGQDGLHEI